jgi:hypothetical protein
MKKKLLVTVTALCLFGCAGSKIGILSVSTATAQEEDTTFKRKSSVKTAFKTHTTSDPGWVYSDDQWTCNGIPMPAPPANYTIHEESVQTDSIDGIFDSKHCQQTLIEVSMSCETSESGWLWNGLKWTYNRKEVEVFPPSYVRIERKRISSVDFDCTQTSVPPQPNVSEVILEEYYVVLDNDWHWDSIRSIWLYKNEDASGKVPPYSMEKSVSTSRGDRKLTISGKIDVF